MRGLTLTLEGSRPWSDEEVTTACKIEIKEGMTHEEFTYRLQDMFVAILEQEHAMGDASEESDE